MLHQFILPESMATVFDQKEKQIENFRRESDGLALAQKPAFRSVDAEHIKLIKVFLQMLHLLSRFFERGLGGSSGLKLIYYLICFYRPSPLNPRSTESSPNFRKISLF